jgi:hypothetical protein
VGVVYNAVELEKRGVPTAVIITSAFKQSLDLLFAGKGMPGHSCIQVPHPVSYLNKEQMTKVTLDHVDEVVGQLTKHS